MSGRASLSSTIVPEQRDEVSPSREDVAAKPPVDDGICVDWDGPDDPANPRNWSLAKKWRITCICSLITFNIALASTLPTSATPFIRIYMGMEKEVSYLITTMFLLGYVFGPFVWGPGSELVGRKAMFYVSMVLYLIFIIPSALAKNTATLLVSRFLTGFFGCAPLALVGGVIADMFPAEGRGLAASLFTVGVFLGPSVGPIIAGYMLDNAVSWRWIFWLLLIFSGFCVAMLFLFVPETYEPTLLKWKARRMRKADPQGNARLYAPNEREDWSPAGVFHSTIYRPFHMFFTEPILLLVTVYVSLVYGILYALFSAIPVVFVTRRNFSISHMGLIFIAVSIGTTLGAFINIVLSAHYPRLIREWRGFPPPEQRLLGAMVGGPLMVVGAFWLGWTGEYADVHWAAPAGSLILIGASISLVFMSFLSTWWTPTSTTARPRSASTPRSGRSSRPPSRCSRRRCSPSWASTGPARSSASSASSSYPCHSCSTSTARGSGRRAATLLASTSRSQRKSPITPQLPRRSRTARSSRRRKRKRS
ncbi:MFS general substrate transporter, partial [Schizophyllum commune Loenen D]